ncbi:hypothetical protein PIB30_073400, partial [Stylosanthes scabra]|nr:hypothetical protein [Stylosanthes scabra]
SEPVHIEVCVEKTTGGRPLPPPPRGPPALLRLLRAPASKPSIAKRFPLFLSLYIKICTQHHCSLICADLPLVAPRLHQGKEPKDEVQIYTWKDATLRELTDLVKEVAPAARRRNAKLSFAFVFPDKKLTKHFFHPLSFYAYFT